MGKHVKNFACPKCSQTGRGTSASLYVADDGSYNWSCHECRKGGKGDPTDMSNEQSTSTTRGFASFKLTREEVQTYPTAALTSRGIREDTVKKFNVKVGYNETTGEVDTHYYPYYIKKELAGYKVRKLPKEWLNSVGSIKGVDPFGWHRLKGGKRLIITEGEIDALTVYQTLSDHCKDRGYPNEPQVVSLATGAEVKTLIQTKEKELKKYAEIILCFDMDEKGKQAVQDFAVAFDTDNVKIMQLPEKDANETLLELGEKPIIDAFYDAKPPELGGMVSLKDCFEMAYEADEIGLDYPWENMTKQSGGNKAPEIFILMSGTGAGKTDITTEIVRYMATVHELDVAFYSLEMSLQKSAKRLVGKQVGRKSLSGTSAEQMQKDREDSKALLERIKFYDIKQGMLDADHLIYLMRQQAALHGTKVHIIDNLTQLTSGSKDEKTIIDKFIKDLKDLAERYDLRVFLIVHLNRNSNQTIGFEAGARIGLEHLYGSGGPAKWADTVLALERNQYHSDEDIRNVTICRWLKDRNGGESTGKTFALKYDHDTGTLSPTKPVDIIEKEDKDEF